ncbi:MAG TPA: carboxypeptidase-like regulatory domain-containing protein [Candidatus Acidoferrales bacterium]|nr:carboxypeptidase-like regulatory domain-containing protein [Candidatus Acidoferrales bacterium]
MRHSVRIRNFFFVAAFLGAALIGAGAASATTITGVVHNGTTGKVAAGVDIILLNLQNGMDAVANTKTDAQGRFSLNYTPSGQNPMLVRASYKGVDFHAMLPPGQMTADVQIFEPATDPDSVKIPTRIVLFQPDGANLLVGEEYEIQNQSKPPVAFFKTAGNFEFQIPEGANLEEVIAAGPEGMGVKQGTMDRGDRRYAIAYAFRPGESRVRISYMIPYASNRAAIHVPSVNSATNVMLLAPPTVTVASAGFQAGGAEQGLSVYVHDGPTSAAGFDVSVSGTAPPPDDAGQSSAGGGSTRDRDSGQTVSAVPPRLDTLKWVLIGGFGSIFLLGAGYLYRRPVAIAADAAGAPVAGGSARSRGNVAGQTAGHMPKRESAPAPSAPDARDTLGEIDRKVGASLDELKDVLFRLELRRQAGTISEQEYTEQRARAEKILRDLVRG